MKELLTRLFFYNQFVAAILLLAVGWFIIEIRDILIALFISFIIMAALAPIVQYLRRYKVPNGVAVAIAYLVTLLCLVVLIFPLVGFFVTQVQLLFSNFPFYLDQAARLFGITVNPAQINSYVGSELNLIGRNAVDVTTKVFGGILSTITILVVSFYLLLDHTQMRHKLASLFPKRYQEEIATMLSQVEEKLGAWLRGQVILSFFIGSLTYIALSIVRLEFALPLAVLAGILEVVPTIGPIISAVPAIIVALTISPTMALIVTLVYFGIQLLENNVLVPRIMQKAVGLNPVVVILGIIIGGKLFGVAGALLSIPFISMCLVIAHHARKIE